MPYGINLSNPLTPGRAGWIRENETAGKALGLDVQAVNATQDPVKWEEVFARLPRSADEVIQ